MTINRKPPKINRNGFSFALDGLLHPGDGIDRANYPPDLGGLVQFAQASVPQRWDLAEDGVYTAIIEVADGELHFFVSGHGHPLDLETAAELQRALAGIGGIRCAEVFETWMAPAPRDGSLPTLTPSQDPERHETLVIRAHDLAGNTLITTARIEAGQDGKRTLAPFAAPAVDSERGGLLGAAIDEDPRATKLRALDDALRKASQH